MGIRSFQLKRDLTPTNTPRTNSPYKIPETTEHGNYGVKRRVVVARPSEMAPLGINLVKCPDGKLFCI